MSPHPEQPGIEATPPPASAPRKGLRTLLRIASSVLGAAMVATIGWVLVQTSFSVGDFGKREPSRFGWFFTVVGEGFARFSYDLLFIFRGPVRVPDACFIYLDEDSARNLNQTGAVWNRELHTRLLQRLGEDNPRAILFDIVFNEPWRDPLVDAEFAAAIRQNGRVFLAGAVESDSGISAGGYRISAEQRVIAPLPILRQAAADWGLILFKPLDGDYGIRRISPGTEQIATAPWRTAVKLGAPLLDTPGNRFVPRWINYYGPAGSFENVSFDRVLADRSIAPGYFRDRIVLVGGRSTLAGLDFGKDDFRNPYTLLGGDFSPGAEVHLTALLNLLNGEWLTRLDPRREIAFAIGIGIVLGAALPRFRPHMAALFAGLSLVGIVIFACWLFAAHRIWFAWSVPAFVQIAAALIWALGTRYFLEERRRAALGDAFGHYLSPAIAERIAESDFDLLPGGKTVEATVLFTDLEGFTPLSEKLDDPELVARILLKYFAQTTTPILDNDGTILNFVGDALTAVWGAPLPEPAHAHKAVVAALQLRDFARINIDGHALRTRVGLHTGLVVAGNFGSVRRFDYAVVGDAVNFASRLEGLNKYFGTDVLLSGALVQKLGDRFATRYIGELRVSGKKEARHVHELLGFLSDQALPGWVAAFERGVRAFQAGDFDDAESRMHETMSLRDGHDGPAQFYLSRIAAARRLGSHDGWTGVIDFLEK